MRKSYWIVGLIGIVVLITAPIVFFWPRGTTPSRDPWSYLPPHLTHTDHKDIIQGPFDSPQAVTQNCLECHPDSASEVMHTTHWTWESQPISVPWRADEVVTIGKKNQINNFCIGIQGNWKKPLRLGQRAPKGTRPSVPPRVWHFLCMCVWAFVYVCVCFSVCVFAGECVPVCPWVRACRHACARACMYAPAHVGAMRARVYAFFFSGRVCERSRIELG